VTKIALEAIGYKVNKDLLIKGNQIDLFVEKNEPLTTNRFIVECKDYNSNISIDKLRSFSQVLASISTKEKPVLGLFVTNRGYTKEAKVFAESLNITLLTLKELLDLSFNVTHVIERIIEKFETDELSGKYIALSCQTAEYSSGTIYKPVEKFIDNFLFNTKRAGAIVLGNFGTGKTSFAKHYSYTLAQRFIQKNKQFKALPIYINLRDVNNLYSLEATLLQTLNNLYNANASMVGLKHWLQNKNTIIILDGFDEMASKMDKFECSNNINSLFNFIESFSLIKVLLTCRTHFFKTQIEENQFKNALRLYIRDWGTEELTDYIKLSNPKNNKDVLNTIRTTYNLEELAKTPLFLNMISKTIEEIGENINKSKLYKIYTDKWIEEQDYRSHTTPAQKMTFMEELAFYFFSKGISSIHYNEISSKLKEYFNLDDNKTLKLIDADVRTCSFLIRTESGEYYFVHKSFLEYFVSLKLAREDKEKNYRNFSIENLTLEITLFFSDYFADETDFILRNILRNTDKTVRANFTLVAGFLKYTDNLLETLLIAIKTDEYNTVKLNGIDSLSHLSHTKGIKELIDFSHQEDEVGYYSLKALSSHCNNEYVVQRFIEIVNTDKNEDKVSISLESLSPIQKKSVLESFLLFITKEWWLKNEKVIYSYLNLVLNKPQFELALFIDKLKKVNKNNYKLVNYIENSMQELSKTFGNEIIDEAKALKNQGFSLDQNRKAVNKKYKFLADNAQTHSAITNLYRDK